MPAAVIDPKTMQKAAMEAARLMKALAHPERLLLLCELSQGERCVSDLEEALARISHAP